MRKNVSPRNKKQINIIFSLKATALDSRRPQINIFKVLQEKKFKSRFFYIQLSDYLNMWKKYIHSHTNSQKLYYTNYPLWKWEETIKAWCTEIKAFSTINFNLAYKSQDHKTKQSKCMEQCLTVRRKKIHNYTQ